MGNFSINFGLAGADVFCAGFFLSCGTVCNSLAFSLIEHSLVTCSKGELTKRFAAFAQNDIMENRNNWLWSHKRWKTRF